MSAVFGSVLAIGIVFGALWIAVRLGVITTRSVERWPLPQWARRFKRPTVKNHRLWQ